MSDIRAPNLERPVECDADGRPILGPGERLVEITERGWEALTRGSSHADKRLRPKGLVIDVSDEFGQRYYDALAAEQ